MCMPEYVYLIRHGHVPGAKPRRFLGRTDLGLSEQGKNQALDLGRMLKPRDFRHIFSSPLLRARQTVELATGLPASDIQLIDQFKEIDLGAWEGLTVAEVRQRFPGQYEARGEDFAAFRPKRGESFQDLQRRVLWAFEAILAKYPGNILIAAHAGVNRVILSHLQKIPLQDLLTIPQEYCALNIIKKNSPLPIVESVNMLTDRHSL